MGGKSTTDDALVASNGGSGLVSGWRVDDKGNGKGCLPFWMNVRERSKDDLRGGMDEREMTSDDEKWILIRAPPPQHKRRHKGWLSLAGSSAKLTLTKEGWLG